MRFQAYSTAHANCLNMRSAMTTKRRAPTVKPLTFAPVQAARLLKEARTSIETLTAQLSACDPKDLPNVQAKLVEAKKRQQMLQQVPVRRKKRRDDG
jgi:hypothetical protein